MFLLQNNPSRIQLPRSNRLLAFMLAHQMMPLLCCNRKLNDCRHCFLIPQTKQKAGMTLSLLNAKLAPPQRKNQGENHPIPFIQKTNTP
jgi:hypothetical protein